MRKFLVLLLALYFYTLSFAQTIKIACIGDSITDGFGLANPSQDAWPILLGDMLGKEYEVRNFGSTGKTLQKNGDQSYWNEHRFEQAKAFAPNIVIIKLGTNDAKERNWHEPENFRKDLNLFINEFVTLPSRPKIYLGTCAWVRKDAIGITGERISDGVIPIVLDTAKKRGLQILDFHALLKDHPEFYCDDIHPNEQGALEMSKFVYKSLTKKSAPELPKLRGKKNDFEGFLRYDFQFKFRNATLIAPNLEKAKGLIWAFTSFKDEGKKQLYKTLLTQGFYILHVDVESWYGNPNSLRWGDEALKYFSDKLGLQTKAIFLGEREGAIYALNYAAKNPNNTAGIIFINPKVDVFAWANESENNMRLFIQEWHLKPEEVEQYKDLALKNLELCADNKTPIFLCASADVQKNLQALSAGKKLNLICEADAQNAREKLSNFVSQKIKEKSQTK